MLRVMRILLWPLALCTVVVASATAAEPVLKISADTGFLDDAYALRPDGEAVADIETDGASSAKLRTTAFGGKPVKVASVSANAVAIYFVTPGKFVVVSRDPKTQKMSAQLYGGSGKIGATDQISMGKVDGRWIIFGHSESHHGKGTEHVVSAYSTETLALITRRDFKEDGEGRIALGGARLKPVWWQDGFGTLATLKAGDYDKAHDIRTPDKFALVDILSGKVREEKAITDMLGFARTMAAHKDHLEEAFAHFNDEHTGLLVSDGLDEYEVKLRQPIAMYQIETLRSEQVDDDRIAVSVVTDPVNPEALKHQKVDPDFFELYIVNRKNHTAQLALRLAAEGRPLSWQVRGQRLLLLRKSKGFDRGGVELDLYDIP